MWVPLALVLFGVGSYVGVTLAGRLSDDRPVQVLVVGAPLLVLGWAFLAVGAESAVALFVLVPVMGMLSFGVGSTLISRVLYESSGAPTMGGSYATAALNCGAVVGLDRRGAYGTRDDDRSGLLPGIATGFVICGGAHGLRPSHDGCGVSGRSRTAKSAALRSRRLQLSGPR
jgi:hypothetical protein